MEDLVITHARRAGTFDEMYQRRLETIYDLPEEERGEAFTVAYSTLFKELELGESLKPLLAEFPILQGLEEVLVFRAVSFREESAELSQDQTKMGLKLRTDRLSEIKQLEPFLRHELMHISDMLDPAFGYRYEPTDGIQGHLVPRRYEVLWDTFIDGRLDRQGQQEITKREERQREFELLFSFLPRRQRATAFQGLWDAHDMTHTQLLGIAKEPAKLTSLGLNVGEVSLRPISGTLCPLCQFPTFEWTDPKPDMIATIQTDFSTWTQDEGICSRCHEYYQMRCEREGATL